MAELHSASPKLLGLPLELLNLVCDYIAPDVDVYALGRCNRQLYQATDTLLYRNNIISRSSSALLWAATRDRPETAHKILNLDSRRIELLASHVDEALVRALQRWSWTVLRILVAYGANPNTQGGCFGHVLQAVSWRGEVDLVRILLDAGANVNTHSGYYGSALQAAAWRGHNDIAAMLISRGADVNDQCGFYGTALQAAARAGHGSMVKQLIHAGALINIKNGRCGSALQAACWARHKHVVRFLIESGATVRKEDLRHGGALSIAIEQKDVRIVEVLIARGVLSFVEAKLRDSRERLAR